MKGDICRDRGCSFCCHETEMILTEDDISRLMEAGRRDFCDRSTKQLRNRNGKCVFLTEKGDCSVYPLRPQGCRLYPLIMKLPGRKPIMDKVCPHHGRFSMDPEDVISLECLIATLEKEGSL
ncbi:MAG: YkgJ family cysteine cluster protein [Thermoplasmatota archaeon]